ncbi:MAG: DUF1080 domain-containing protein [Phycisphaeraceae bacterium]|nr:DUF1080 domain-containing protein [Phycisphaeraceae bacterium]
MRIVFAIAAIVCGQAGAAAQPAADQQVQNALTPAEAAAGWMLLFDGASTRQWRSYKGEGFPQKGWVVENGTVRVVKGGGGGDIVTVKEYEDFEFSLDFKCARGANSGIMYRVAETQGAPWMTGPEFQILDNAGHSDGADPKHRAGALYDLIEPPPETPPAPPGQWNNARIRIRDGVLQQFLNGVKTAECRIDNDDWKAMIAASKFKAWPSFGMEKKGRIALQDHGDDVWFRNIKVRDLKAPMPGEQALFEGPDLAGWPVFPEATRRAWSWREGVLACEGNATGYIRTNEAFESFVLRLQWRFDPKGGGGNSGVLLRVQPPDAVWPPAVEMQLKSGQAGDLLSIGRFPMSGDAARTSGRRVDRMRTVERPVGEWNDCEVIADGAGLVVRINGEVVNEASEVAVKPGTIALQAEGAEIQFRAVKVAPIK